MTHDSLQTKEGYFKVHTLSKHAQEEGFTYSEHIKVNIATVTRY